MNFHPHIHAIVLGGGLDVKNHWKDNGKEFFLYPPPADRPHLGLRLCRRHQDAGRACQARARQNRGIFAVLETVLLHISEGLRRRGIAVPRDSLARCYRKGLRR